MFLSGKTLSFLKLRYMSEIFSKKCPDIVKHQMYDYRFQCSVEAAGTSERAQKAVGIRAQSEISAGK